MYTIGRLSIGAFVVAALFMFAPNVAQAAVASNTQALTHFGVANTAKSAVEQTQYRRGPRCRTVYVTRCRTRYVRRCTRWTRGGRCVRWVSRPVQRCYRVPRRICR